MYDTAPDSIVARLARRDVSIASDRVSLYLDPFHDHRTGYYFMVNAAGTVYDGTISNEIMDAAITAAASCAGWAADHAALAQAKSTACCPAELMQMLEDARKAGEEEAFRSMIGGSAQFA